VKKIFNKIIYLYILKIVEFLELTNHMQEFIKNIISNDNTIVTPGDK
jgi:hypothetical protein